MHRRLFLYPIYCRNVCENTRDINICSGSGLNDGHGQTTTEDESSDEDDEEYHTASLTVMCLKVGKENIKVTCMNNLVGLVVCLYGRDGGGQ